MSETNEPSPYKIQGPHHAYLTGLAWGLAMRNGIMPMVELDEDGNFSASALIALPDDAPVRRGTTIRLIIDAPPEDAVEAG